MAFRPGRLVFAVAIAGLFSACPLAVVADGSTDITGTIPLVASGVTTTGITSSEATISWTTNGAANSQVFYDTTSYINFSDYTFSSIFDPTEVGSHSVILTGLTAGATYHFMVRSVMPAINLSAVSTDNSFTTTTSGSSAGGGGGGGGGSGGFGSQLVGIGLAGTSPFMDGNGRAITAGQVQTSDNKLQLTVPVGTYVWNAAGAAQTFLSATVLTNPPVAPPQNSLVMTWEMGPSGVTFKPAATLTFNYADSDIPSDTPEADLYIAWWDGTAWVKLAGTVNPASNTVTVQITHFTSFALIAPAAPPVPAPTLKIASPSTGTSFDSGSVTVSISTGNINLVTDNRPNADGEGRAVYYLDVPIPSTPGLSALPATGTYKESASNINIWTNLAPGTHILGVQLVQNDHTPFNPPIFSTINVMVKEAVIVPPATTVPAPTEQLPLPTTPSPGTTKAGWLIPILFLIAALALGGFLYWRSRRPEAKLKYTNR